MLQKPAGEAGIGSKQQRLLAFDDAGVEVRHRHRRRSLGGLAVDLGMMAVAYCALVAPQPDSADREAAIPMAFADARLLEQLDGSPTRADEDEFGRHRVALQRVDVLDTHPPSAVVLTVQTHHAMLVTQRNAGLGGKMLD